MNILNIIQCTNLGGMEQASLRLMKSLQLQGDVCRLISLNPMGELGPLLDSENIAAVGICYRGKGGWRSYLDQRRIISTYGKNADAMIMTGHNLLAMFAMGDLARGRRILAMHFHHSGVKPNWHWRLIYEIACKKFTAITFPSDFIREEAVKICPKIARMSWTVRNPLPLQVVPSVDEKMEARISLGISTEGKVVGNAGWLIHRKRFDIFLKVAQNVLMEEPQTIFVLAGDGQERAALSSLAEKLGIDNKIIWLGWKSDLKSFYMSLDVLLFNSDWDAFPTTPLEAMSWGVPVVASNINGGLNEVIDCPKYGFLFRHHDVQGMSSAVCNLLAGDKGLIGLQGRQKVLEMCDPLLVAGRVRSLF